MKAAILINLGMTGSIGSEIGAIVTIRKMRNISDKDMIHPVTSLIKSLHSL